jgi:hypothetical protein
MYLEGCNDDGVDQYVDIQRIALISFSPPRQLPNPSPQTLFTRVVCCLCVCVCHVPAVFQLALKEFFIIFWAHLMAMALIQFCCCWSTLRSGCYASALYTMVSQSKLC